MRFRAPQPAELDGRETWLTSALHGIRVVAGWVSQPIEAGAAARAPPGARSSTAMADTGRLRHDRRGLRHFFDVAVALVGDDGAVQTHRERFAFWPFTEEQLREDLRAAGLEPEGAGVPADKAGRYLVTARRAS